MNDHASPPSAPWRVAVTGSHGLIGSALVESLRSDGHEVHRVVRSDPQTGEIGWDPAAGRIDAGGFAGLDAVVHLAGENVGERWTEERKARIRSSRVQGTDLLSEALASLSEPPRVLVSASAVGYYGDRGEEVLEETSASGRSGFLPEVARGWEAATAAASGAGIRVVMPRLGVVLSRKGGALQRMLLPFQLGTGGTLGSGEQWMSWISLPDVVRALRFMITTPDLSGPVNTVAPEPVTNAEFTRVLGEVLHRPTLLSVPEIALRLAFGQMADEALLVSQRAVPTRLLAAGFAFQDPTLREALRTVLRAE